MKLGLCQPAATLFAVMTHCFIVAQAAPFETVQNSKFSIPTATLAFLNASNLMVSAVSPGTLNGGHAYLKNSQIWAQRYGVPATFQNSSANAIVTRSDGSLVATGPSRGNGSALDFATICYSRHGVPLWTNRYDSPAHGDDTSGYLVADAAGNLWVTGQSMRYATNWTLTDVVTIKYAANGVPLWTNRYSSFETNGAYASGLAVDAVGNAYVPLLAAYWTGASGTPVEEAIIKYDSSGNIVWIKHYFASGPDSGQGLHRISTMALDKEGSLLVAGGTGRPSYHTGDSIVKFMDDGTPVWTNYHPFGFIFQFRFLSTDQEGDIIATGESQGYVVMKCSKDGVSLWTNTLAGPPYSGGGVPQTSIDPAGNVFLIGGSPGASPGRYQILKISSAGIPLWTNLNANFGTTNSAIGASAVDNAGNLYLTGYAPANNGERDWVTMKFSGDGQLVWSNRFNGAGDQEDIPSAIAVNQTGELYVAGRSEGQNGKSDFVTVKYADTLFYSPPEDFVGLDTISYLLTDLLGNSTTESVDILVVPGSFYFDLSPTATRMTPAGMLLQVHGAPKSSEVILEASSDTVSWQRISTNTPVQGSVQFLDSSVSNVSKRFYRVSQEQ